jgi:hypothetical protein
VVAERLDRLLELDLALVDLDALALQELADVPEVTEPYSTSFSPTLRGATKRRLPIRSRQALELDLLLRPASPRAPCAPWRSCLVGLAHGHGQPAREQEVAAVALGHLHTSPRRPSLSTSP